MDDEEVGGGRQEGRKARRGKSRRKVSCSLVAALLIGNLKGKRKQLGAVKL